MKAATTLGGGSRDRKAISIHAAREGGDDKGADFLSLLRISIHAAREGGDGRFFYKSADAQKISIHAAREGGDFHAG